MISNSWARKGNCQLLRAEAALSSGSHRGYIRWSYMVYRVDRGSPDKPKGYPGGLKVYPYRPEGYTCGQVYPPVQTGYPSGSSGYPPLHLDVSLDHLDRQRRIQVDQRYPDGGRGYLGGPEGYSVS